MRNDKVMLESAKAGYSGQPDDGLWSSPCWMAHQAGKAMAAKGYTMPTAAAMSRGFSVRLQTAANEFIARFSGDLLDTIAIERLG